MASLPVSLTFVWKMTLLPSFHISVTSVSPGSTVPAKRTLMFLNAPNLSSDNPVSIPATQASCLE